MSFDFRLHNVTYSEVDDNGFVGVQFDAFGEEKSGMPTVEVMHPYGLMSQPAEPDPNVDAFTCQALIGWEGHSAYAWLCSDPRTRVLTPYLKKGETLLYGHKGNFVRMHDDGRVSVFTTDDGTINGKTISFQVKPDGFLWAAPWGKMTFDATGFHVLHASGAAIDLGAIGGVPAPLDALSSYVKLTGAMAQIEASAVAVGTASTPADPPAKTTPLLAVLGSIALNLEALQAAIAALPGVGTGAGAPALITAAATATTNAVAAIGAAANALPSAALGVS